MKELFSGFYRPSEGEFKVIWDDALFILDANILLNLYRYPDNAREELFKVFESISNRLWVPYQAALEFQRNRLSVIAEQKKRFSDVRMILDSTKSGMKSQLDQLGLAKRHSSIRTEELFTKISEHIESYLSELTDLENKQISVSDNDPLRDRIDVLFHDRIGKPFTQAEIDEIYDSGDKRYSQKIPPGYRDINKVSNDKKEYYSYSGVAYQEKYGDLVIWNQIIQKAMHESIGSIIFLTDDEKDDWWWIIEVEGKKKIGPRPELIEEIKLKAGVKIFHMYNSEQFLKFSKTYLSASVSEESITQIHDVVKSRAAERLLKRVKRRMAQEASLVEEVVYEWLEARHPDTLITPHKGFPDFIAYSSNFDRKRGFEVLIVRNASLQTNKIKRVLVQAQEEINSGSIDEMTIIFALKKKDSYDALRNLIRDDYINFNGPLSLIFGLIDTVSLSNKDDFKPQFNLMAEISNQ